MIKILKLKKAIYIILLGIVALIVAQIMGNRKVEGSNIVLGISGVLLILGAFLSLYPVLFAKKVDKEGDNVELKPISSEPLNEEDAS